MKKRAAATRARYVVDDSVLIPCLPRRAGVPARPWVTETRLRETGRGRGSCARARTSATEPAPSRATLWTRMRRSGAHARSQAGLRARHAGRPPSRRARAAVACGRPSKAYRCGGSCGIRAARGRRVTAFPFHPPRGTPRRTPAAMMIAEPRRRLARPGSRRVSLITSRAHWTCPARTSGGTPCTSGGRDSLRANARLLEPRNPPVEI